MFTKEAILAEGLEALTEVDTAADLSVSKTAHSWFREQALDLMQELGIEADRLTQLEDFIEQVYTQENSTSTVESLNDALHGIDHEKCLLLCRLLTANLYEKGGEHLRSAIEKWAG